jgi:hypothetical protein
VHSPEFVPNYFADVTSFFDDKLKAIAAHRCRAISPTWIPSWCAVRRPPACRSTCRTRAFWVPVGALSAHVPHRRGVQGSALLLAAQLVLLVPLSLTYGSGSAALVPASRGPVPGGV